MLNLVFEEGNLLFFRPFLFKNGADPQDKFFLVLKKMDGDILLASLPTSKTMYHRTWKWSMGA